MFDEPNESPSERAPDPLVRAREKSDEFRMHAELAAVFEGCRKFGARIDAKLDANVAREIQRTIGRLEKSRSPDHPALTDESAAEAAALLALPGTDDLSTNDYHINRRPGEVMIVRWLAAEQVETFYERFQQHFDVALHQFREEEQQSHAWKQQQEMMKYLGALDATDIRMADRYLRGVIRESNLFVLSTQSADEIDILHLCEYLMGVEVADVVGKKSVPPDEPTEADRAWFFKLFSLRGILDGAERMCFFAYLQKTDDGD